MDLSEQVGIVTGSTSGIGRAMALDLAAKGAKLVLTGRDQTRGAEVVAEVEALGSQAVFIAADLADPKAPEALVKATEDQFGKVDFLINNAALLVSGTAVEHSDDDWNKVIDVNLSAVFRMSRAVIPGMTARKSGVILNVASEWAMMAVRGYLAYCVSKAAIAQLTRCMALDHAADGIRVNAICPTATDTPMLLSDPEGAERDAKLRARGESIPMGRVAKVEEVASVASFLLSDGAAFMTGALVPVDGGTTAQ